MEGPDRTGLVVRNELNLRNKIIIHTIFYYYYF